MCNLPRGSTAYKRCWVVHDYQLTFASKTRNSIALIMVIWKFLSVLVFHFSNFWISLKNRQVTRQALVCVCVCVCVYFIYLVVLGVSFGTRAALRHVRSQIPDQGSNPCPLDCNIDFKPLDHQGSPLFCFFKKIFVYSL